MENRRSGIESVVLALFFDLQEPRIEEQRRRRRDMHREGEIRSISSLKDIYCFLIRHANEGRERRRAYKGYETILADGVILNREVVDDFYVIMRNKEEWAITQGLSIAEQTRAAEFEQKDYRQMLLKKVEQEIQLNMITGNYTEILTDILFYSTLKSDRASGETNRHKRETRLWCYEVYVEVEKHVAEADFKKAQEAINIARQIAFFGEFDPSKYEAAVSEQCSLYLQKNAQQLREYLQRTTLAAMQRQAMSAEVEIQTRKFQEFFGFVEQLGRVRRSERFSAYVRPANVYIH